MKLRDVLFENNSFSNWKKPSDSVLKREYHVEYELKGLGDRLGNPWPSASDFVQDVKTARVITVDKGLDSRISNRSHTRTKDQLISLLKTYRSWPQFRNKQTVDEIYDGFINNEEMELPIVLSQDGMLRVFSGNTRLDIAFQLGITPKAILVELE